MTTPKGELFKIGIALTLASFAVVFLEVRFKGYELSAAIDLMGTRVGSVWITLFTVWWWRVK